MSRVENQRRLFLELVEVLRPHWRRDPGQPQRLAEWLARHRAGSRDRRLYRELTYTLWRILPWVEDADPETVVSRVAQNAQRTKATEAFIDTYAAPSSGLPPPSTPLIPDWFSAEFPGIAEPSESACLLSRAPLWIRQQTADADSIGRELPEAEASSIIPGAWHLPTDYSVLNVAAYREGRIEIQDIGSQALLHALPELPAGRWMDACAGAGGKTLQLAQLLHDHEKTEIVAHDIRASALRELELRRDRAGLSNISITRSPEGPFDVVLVDAPCSGTGTWRRAPHLKWTTSPVTIRQAADKQRALLAKFAAFVRHGGWLVYLTCSLCESENQAVIADFQMQHPEFRPLPLRDPRTGSAQPTGQLTLRPSALDSDGYFVAGLQRN